MSTPSDSSNYSKHRTAAGERAKSQSLAGREIGPIPPVANPERRRAAGESLRLFCESYFPGRFSLAWSPDHLRVIARLEAAIRGGGLYALAMPRASGKTTLCEVAGIWATFNAYRKFLLLIGSSRPAALEMMQSIQGEIESNDLLAEDYPEICYPVQCLEGITNRCAGQIQGGERTHIRWRKDELVLPTIAGSSAGGAIIRVAGILGRVRGTKFTRPDGSMSRPDLVLLDDCQTDASAHSETQCRRRENVITGCILGLTGPDQQIAAVFPCTVIEREDLADRMLSRDKHPEWQGERFKLVYAFPSATKLWDEYSDMRRDELRNGGAGQLATEFFRQHQTEMEKDAIVAWPQRKFPNELSPVQHVMNLLSDLGKSSFFAEYQNEPLQEEAEEGQLKAVAARVNGLAHGKLPLAGTRLTAFVDVQQKALFYAVVAWSDDFTGWVVDYGTYPDQQRKYFKLVDCQRTLARAAPGAGLEGSIHAGLTKLGEQLLGRDWPREDGTGMRIGRLLIDANWGQSTDTIYAWCRQTVHAAQVLPAHGRYVGAASKPWSEYQKRPGEQLGHHWLLTASAGKRAVRHVVVDVNFWKSFVRERLNVPLGDRGALTLFGKPRTDHQLLSEHCTAEYSTRTAGRGRTVDEWKLRPEKPDNHWWDCLVGCAAAASMLGSVLPDAQDPGRQRKRVSWAEKQRQAAAAGKWKSE